MEDAQPDRSEPVWIVAALNWVVPSLLALNMGLTIFYGSAVLARQSSVSAANFYVSSAEYREAQATQRGILSNTGSAIILNVALMVIAIVLALVAISPWAQRHPRGAARTAWFGIGAIIFGLSVIANQIRILL
jgi:hypothetical protein